MAYIQDLMKRKFQETSSLPTNWQDVASILSEMDKTNNAYFKLWVQSEENIVSVSSRLKQIVVDYPADQVENGLKWLIKNWDPNARAYLMNKLFIEDFWARKATNILQLKVEECQNFIPEIDRRRSLISNQDEICLNKLVRTIRIPKKVQIEENENFKLKGVAYQLSESEIQKRLRIIDSVFLSDLPQNHVCSLISRLLSLFKRKEEKEYFLIEISKNWDFNLLSSVTIFLGSEVDWNLKKLLLKRFQPERKVHHHIQQQKNEMIIDDFIQNPQPRYHIDHVIKVLEASDEDFKVEVNESVVSLVQQAVNDKTRRASYNRTDIQTIN